jgi:hypothetical protein
LKYQKELVMVQATEQYWLAQVKDLEQQLVREKAKLLVLQKQLDSVQVSESDLRLQLHRLLAKEKAQELALQKALAWDLG